MNKLLGPILVFVLMATASHAQDTGKILATYKGNFAKASLTVKIEILQDAASNKGAQDMGPLFLDAVDFLLNNFSFVDSDTQYRQLAQLAIEQIAAIRYTPAKQSLWKVFQLDADTGMRVKAAGALGVISTGDAEVIGNLNQWLAGQNAGFPAGKMPDLQVFTTLLPAIGKLGDPSSFPILFRTMILGYSEKVTALAREALLSVKGDFQTMLTGVLKNSTFPEKRQALVMALESDKLTEDQKGALAEYALDVGLHTAPADTASKDIAREMRQTATRALSDRKWSKATALLIEHLDTTIMENDRGLSDKRFLLEAVGALGNMASHEAAVRLTNYLVLLNSYTEKGRSYDEQTVLMVIDNLGKLGDKVAFDDLMYTQYLNYTSPIKKKARAALDNLKW
jgi:hypothetical protein